MDMYSHHTIVYPPCCSGGLELYSYPIRTSAQLTFMLT